MNLYCYIYTQNGSVLLTLAFPTTPMMRASPALLITPVVLALALLACESRVCLFAQLISAVITCVTRWASPTLIKATDSMLQQGMTQCCNKV